MTDLERPEQPSVWLVQWQTADGRTHTTTRASRSQADTKVASLLESGLEVGLYVGQVHYWQPITPRVRRRI